MLSYAEETVLLSDKIDEVFRENNDDLQVTGALLASFNIRIKKGKSPLKDKNNMLNRAIFLLVALSKELSQKTEENL